MRRSQRAPGLAAGANHLSLQAHDPQADPFLAAVTELSRFADQSDAPQDARRIVSRFIQERPDLLFQLCVSPGEVTDLDDCVLSFTASSITGELLKAIRDADWDAVLAIGSRYLD
jgi:hypothetical protein